MALTSYYISDTVNSYSKAVGSNPTPATNERKRQEVDCRSRPAFSVCVDREADCQSHVRRFLSSTYLLEHINHGYVVTSR